jgi:hypothetical protein
VIDLRYLSFGKERKVYACVAIYLDEKRPAAKLKATNTVAASTQEVLQEEAGQVTAESASACLFLSASSN